MCKKEFIAALLGSTMLIATGAGVAADEMSGEQQMFLDRDRLAETLLADEQAELDDAKVDAEASDAALASAEAALQDLNNQISGLPEGDSERTALEAEAEELEAKIENELRPEANAADTRLHEAEAAYDDEQALVSSQVEDMPEDVLFAFNRSLNNAVKSGLIVDIDSEHIQAALDGDYDKRQINALTKALEEEAKFASRAQFFADKAEETGDDKFLEKAEEMEARGEAQKEKFLEKIARYDESLDALDDDEIENEAEHENEHAYEHEYDDDHSLTEEAREAAKEAREEAREAVKEAREEAREAAKEAREEAREAAKEAREDAREAAKAAAEEAQEAAEEAAKEAAKDAAED